MRTTELEDNIHLQLERVSSSATFQQVDRLKRFLRFIVLETAAGRGDRLKEYVIGVEVFAKEASFDPRTDPIVRVQARRLRERLARYYRDEGAADSLLIELPKGGYAPVFKHLEPAQPKRSVTGVLASRNTISVLPFFDYTDQGGLKHFCKGLTQEIIHALTQSKNLRIVIWDQGTQNAGTLENLREGASRLNVAIVVSGSVRISGSTARITVDLIDGPSGSYLWSEWFDRSMEETFKVQEEVAAAVCAKLGETGAGAGVGGKWFARSHANLAARNLYLQGRYHMDHRTEEGLRKAVEFFERALTEDAQYAQAFAGLADAWGLLGHYGVLAPAEVWTKTASSSASAVMQDEDSAETHTSLAHVKSTQDWDWMGAEKEFRRAIDLDPRYPTGHHWYAMSCLAPMARMNEALEQMLIAQSLDPVSSIIARDLALIYLYRREFDSALEQIDHTIELNPHFSPAYWALGLIQEQRSDFDESLAAFERAIQLSPGSPRMHGGLGRTLALSGKRKHALKILNELGKLAESRYVSPFELASIHFALRETEQGFEWLGKAFQDRCFELLLLLVDPRFDSLRSDARFTALANQLGLPGPV
jgi:TolB-like protein/Tfp pilus assembly protein PilF